MTNPIPPALSTLALLGVSLAADLGERVDGVIRVATLLALLGNLIAYHRYQSAPKGTDPFPIIARWTGAGLLLGLAIELASELS